MRKTQPTVGVITVVYNAAEVVAWTLQSVRSQTYPYIKSIIIDGKSTDTTLAIVGKFANDNMRIHSEKDTGIYDAMNKGLRLADCDYVIFMNAGDEFFSPTTIEEALSQHADADVYYGNTVVVDKQRKTLGDRRLSPPKKLTWKSLQRGMLVSHQSLIVKKSLCEDFDLHYEISADIDWTIHVLKRARSIVNTQLYIAKYLQGGVSSARRLVGLRERFRIMRKHYGLLTTLMNHVFITVRFVVHLFTKKTMT